MHNSISLGHLNVLKIYSSPRGRKPAADYVQGMASGNPMTTFAQTPESEAAIYHAFKEIPAFQGVAI